PACAPGLRRSRRRWGATDEPGALPEARTATLVVSLTPRRERAGVSRQRIETDLRQRLQDLPGVRVNVGAGETYTLALSGEDSDVLARHAAVVERELRSLPGVGQVSLQ